MKARKIVINDCNKCWYRANRPCYGVGEGLFPVCGKTGDPLPFDMRIYTDGRQRAIQSPGIPYWCPLPADSPAAAEIQPERAGATQPVAVSSAFTLLDAREFPPPKGKKILCGSAVRFGTTVIGLFDHKGHDCWLPMPGFPDSLKKMR